MARGPMDVWNEWAPQILVLLSFTLQLILLLLAGIRRRRGASRLLMAVLKGVLWLAYQLADSTAIYAIGHLSLCNPPPEHQLVPFWAPFLLLHLGGPDSITAYSLEDTKLWLRHLVSVLVQVSGAAYVLYKQFSGSQNSLRLAAVLMFVVGVVKYGERTWALRCGNTETIRRSLKKEPRTKCYSYIKDKPHQRSFETEADEEEFLVCCAHTLFHICKYAVVDDSLDDSAGDIQTRDTTLVGELNEEKLYVVMGIELSLMYDILYTKASVIHTWIGYFIRVASPVTITGSVIIFQFSGKYGQNIVDIAITYVLLTGALLLEVISLLRALGSSWTFPFLCAARWNWLKHAALCSGKWHWFRHKIVSLRHLFKVTGINRYCTPSRRLSGSIGQYNMLHFCTRRCTSYSPLLGWLAKLLGQEDWWETYHYSGIVKIPLEVKHDVFKYIKKTVRKDDVNTLGVIRKNWGEETLKLLSRKLVDSPSTYLGAEFQEGIIIWHIATELFLTRCRRAKDDDAAPTVEAIKALSNYMMFLQVDRPDMLPGLAQNRLYQRTCTSLEKEWHKVMDDPTYHHPTRNVYTILKELFCLHDSPNYDPRCPPWGKLVSKLLEKKPELTPENSRVRFAIDVAKDLLEKEEEKRDDKEKEKTCSLEVLLQMWIDFLVYAANRCSREAHAKKLNSGGEFTTVLWLLTEHLYQARKLFYPSK